MTWWACPNVPPCPHGGAVHDVEDLEDEVPRCCMEGCDCGRDREAHLRLGHLFSGPDVEMHQELLDASPDGQERIRGLVAELPDVTVRLGGYLVGTLVALTRYEDGRPVAVVVDRADPYVLMSQELYDQADREFLRVDGDLITLGTPGERLGVVTYRVLRRDEAEGTLLLKRES
jgi:hypothetical protein